MCHHSLVPLLLWPPPPQVTSLCLPSLLIAPAKVTIQRLVGGGGTTVGHKSSGLTDYFTDSLPASPDFSTGGGDDVDANMSTEQVFFFGSP